jgi:hypothetical protein
VAAIAREPLAATAAKPIVRAPVAAAPAAKPKPSLATEGALPLPGAAARPVARPSRPLLSDPSLQ